MEREHCAFSETFKHNYEELVRNSKDNIVLQVLLPFPISGQHMQQRERETAIYGIELKQITEIWKREHI